MEASENNLIPENAASVLAEAIEQAGEYTTGQQAKVSFDGAFHDGEGFDSQIDLRDGKLRRRRNFTVTLPPGVTEQFVQHPSLKLIFDHYLPLDRLIVLEVDSITIEYVAQEARREGDRKITKVLRASVMRQGEWFKREQRDQAEWELIRRQVLQRDNSTCVYCGWKAQKFQQVNHIGAEDDHTLDNLETVCAACHAVLHLGIRAMEGFLSVFDCKPELTNMARIVRATRLLVSRKTPWPEIERQVLEHYAFPNGHIHTCDEAVGLANQMLKSIPPGEYRGYLPEGKSILFHQSPPWNGFPETVCRWQLSR